MAKLNEKNDITKKIIHLMITDKCDRKCPDCCNNQYDIWNTVDRVTPEELKEAETIFLTGGEPFAYSDPTLITKGLKTTYPNIKKVYVYTNAYELLVDWILLERNLDCIDGLTISVKSGKDMMAMSAINKNKEIRKMAEKGNIRIYVFEGYEAVITLELFDRRKRVWQKDFIPAPDSIFRRL